MTLRWTCRRPSMCCVRKGPVPKFNGWMAVYEQLQKDGQSATTGPEAEDDAVTGLLPALSEGDALELKKVTPEQKFTQPPARFSEATLVKELEENGIGRPSTYASIIGVLQVREYAEKVEGRFRPTRLGRLVTDLLAESFDRIIQVDYTREMEERLDEIEAGEADYEGTLATFYKAFKDDLAKAAKSMPDIKTKGLPSDETCKKCQSPMIIKVGKFGMFFRLLGLSGLHQHAGARADRGAHRPGRRGVRELRSSDGAQEG